MTIFGYIFWGACLFIIGLSYFMEKKYGSKGLDKDKNMLEREEITRVTHTNDRPRF